MRAWIQQDWIDVRLAELQQLDVRRRFVRIVFSAAIGDRIGKTRLSLYIGYNTVCSGIRECNKRMPLQTVVSGGNVRWPRRMLPPGGHGEYVDGTDRQTDGRTPDRYNITFSARRGQRKSSVCVRVSSRLTGRRCCVPASSPGCPRLTSVHTRSSRLTFMASFCSSNCCPTRPTYDYRSHSHRRHLWLHPFTNTVSSLSVLAVASVSLQISLRSLGHYQLR